MGNDMATTGSSGERQVTMENGTGMRKKGRKGRENRNNDTKAVWNMRGSAGRTVGPTEVVQN